MRLLPSQTCPDVEFGRTTAAAGRFWPSRDRVSGRDRVAFKKSTLAQKILNSLSIVCQSVHSKKLLQTRSPRRTSLFQKLERVITNRTPPLELISGFEALELSSLFPVVHGTNRRGTALFQLNSQFLFIVWMTTARQGWGGQFPMRNLSPWVWLTTDSGAPRMLKSESKTVAEEAETKNWFGVQCALQIKFGSGRRQSDEVRSGDVALPVKITVGHQNQWHHKINQYYNKRAFCRCVKLFQLSPSWRTFRWIRFKIKAFKFAIEAIEFWCEVHRYHIASLDSCGDRMIVRWDAAKVFMH